MTDNTELKRLAERVIEIEALDGGEPIGEAWGEFEAAATPAAVLALIADLDEACNGMKHSCAIRLKKQIEQLEEERDRLRAEVAGLKTGYEAYERVNAELKAELEHTGYDHDLLRNEYDQLKAELSEELKRSWDGNEISAREHDDEVRKLKAEIDRLNEEYDKAWRHDLNDKKNVQVLAAEVARLSVEKDALRKLAVELRGSAECHNVHHCKAEQHELGDPCKVLARIDAALRQGEQSEGGHQAGHKSAESIDPEGSKGGGQ